MQHDEECEDQENNGENSLKKTSTNAQMRRAPKILILGEQQFSFSKTI